MQFKVVFAGMAAMVLALVSVIAMLQADLGLAGLAAGLTLLAIGEWSEAVHLRNAEVEARLVREREALRARALADRAFEEQRAHEAASAAVAKEG